MIFFELQITTIFITILWFDIFGVHRAILRLFDRGSWETMKPFTCYFCMNFWIGAIGALVYCLTSGDLKTAILFVMINTVVSRFLDTFLGYKSIKDK